MTFIGHAVLFFLAGFTGILFNADRNSSLGIFLLFGLPVAGVYFLGWWALLTFIVGLFFGGAAFWKSDMTGRINREE